MTIHRMQQPNRFASRHRGAVLVCVLVILLVVTMLAMQAVQTLALVRRSDSRRTNLRQALELVELGKMAVVQRELRGESMGEEPLNWVVQVDAGENLAGTLVVSTRPVAEQNEQSPDASLNEESSAETSANEVSDLTNDTNDKPRTIRVLAAFPAGREGELKASWESQR